MTLAVEFGHVQPVEVHFDDLDAMGVLHNGRYAVLFERALSAYWSPRGWAFDPASPRFAEIFFVVQEFAIRYRRPILGVGPVAVHFWIDDLGETNVDYRFRFLASDGRVHAEGHRRQVKVDRDTLRPAPLSAAVRAACTALLGPAAADRLAS